MRPQVSACSNIRGDEAAIVKNQYMSKDRDEPGDSFFQEKINEENLDQEEHYIDLNSIQKPNNQVGKPS